MPSCFCGHKFPYYPSGPGRIILTGLGALTGSCIRCAETPRPPMLLPLFPRGPPVVNPRCIETLLAIIDENFLTVPGYFDDEKH